MSAQSPRVDDSSAFIGFNDLVGLLHAVFVKHGTSPQVAQILAHNCASAERDGAHSHGIFRMPGYISTLESGWVDGKATPVVTDVASGFVRVDAANGFAQPALAAARALLVDKARSAGIALLAIHNSHHFAALWPDVEPFAEQGLVALSVVNSMTCVVPHGADRPLFGTNPIAFAAPRADGAPIVFDPPPAPSPMVTCRLLRATASACRRAWASTAWASRPRTPRPSSKAVRCCRSAGTRARRCR